MLKKIARRILKNEIEKLKQENETRSKEHWDLINEHTKKEYELTKHLELIKKESKTTEETLKNLSAENEIMRKYYRLDSEPTDEEKIKIRVDLRIHELEMQIIKERIESLERSRTVILPGTPLYNSVLAQGRYRQKGDRNMDLDCSRYFSLNTKLFLKKLKRYGGIFKCSRKGYQKSRYLKWKKRVMKRSASKMIGQKVKRRR